jgi:hypothetical protein
MARESACPPSFWPGLRPCANCNTCSSSTTGSQDWVVVPLQGNYSIAEQHRTNRIRKWLSRWYDYSLKEDLIGKRACIIKLTKLTRLTALSVPKGGVSSSQIKIQVPGRRRCTERFEPWLPWMVASDGRWPMARHRQASSVDFQAFCQARALLALVAAAGWTGSSGSSSKLLLLSHG